MSIFHYNNFHALRDKQGTSHSHQVIASSNDFGRSIAISVIIGGDGSPVRQ
ncbi:hypothetical protein B4113_3043 [Geobacillus sp. B4113_201601]|nr:hypothetical protein B4113_3043 [Geobacillus sp. B4113_201601]